ncbi:hypothetical protein [Sphingomonas morindae]|uniref:DUF883 family protein n=1 Tax=Sphingomonas morindae TaxID=1541170 RepID=A0ABY4X7V3_9SPHN|nr:hypothetical protein [Sphingomonas morindae]USI73034.1 hypothetical protein LHA26_00715 [Sphingomonas morindae]
MSASDNSQPATSGAAGVKKPLRDGIDSVKAHLGDAAHAAQTATHGALDRAGEAYASGLDKARGAGEGIGANPLTALAGGLVLGVALGALLPRTERETALFGAAGQRLNGAARDAAEAARGAGRDKLAELGFSRDSARDTMKSLFEAVIAAATSAGSAAADAARTSGR